MAEILHVGFAGGVADDRLAFCQDGGHQGALRGRHAAFVEEDVSTVKPVRGLQADDVVRAYFGAHGLERLDVGIDASTTDSVTSGAGNRRLSVAGNLRRT
jgi:hypothetical protein